MFPVGFSFIPGSKAWPEDVKISTFHSGILGTPGLPEACRAGAHLPAVSPPDPLTPGSRDFSTGRTLAQPELLPVGNPVSPQWEEESWGEVKVQGGQGSSSQLALGPTPPLGGVEAVGDPRQPAREGTWDIGSQGKQQPGHGASLLRPLQWPARDPCSPCAGRATRRARVPQRQPEGRGLLAGAGDVL